jgi:hypothetical protein
LHGRSPAMKEARRPSGRRAGGGQESDRCGGFDHDAGLGPVDERGSAIRHHVIAGQIEKLAGADAITFHEGWRRMKDGGVL